MPRIVAFQRDGLLFGILNLCPRLDDIHLIVCLIKDFDGDGLQLVLHREDMCLRSILSVQFIVLDFQFKVQFAVGMKHLQSGQLHHVHRAKGR